MVRKNLLYFEIALIAVRQVFAIMSVLVGLFPAFAQTKPPSETAHPSEAALNDPNIVQDFMTSLPPSDPIARQYLYFNNRTLKTESADRPEQEAYYQLRRSVTAHRFLTNKERGRREMKAILLRASQGFAAECAAKGGYLEPKNSNFYSRTDSNIRPKTWPKQLDICMRSNSVSLGALLIETNKNSFDYGDEDSHGIITFHPEVVVTQAWLDAQAEREAKAQRKRDAA
jgi:hypothetical protein